MSPVSFWNVVDAGARVQAPFTLSETRTWPAVLYWANQPTSKSPAPTGEDRALVVDATRPPVAKALPWTNDGEVAAEALAKGARLRTAATVARAKVVAAR